MMVWTDEEWRRVQRLSQSDGFAAEAADMDRYAVKYYDQDLDPMTAAEWAVATSRMDGWKRVGLLETDRVRISTVWIGISYGVKDGDTIGVFETLMEGEEAEDFDGDHIMRHRSRPEAVKAFTDLVAAATMTDDVVILEKLLPS